MHFCWNFSTSKQVSNGWEMKMYLIFYTPHIKTNMRHSDTNEKILQIKLTENKVQQKENFHSLKESYTGPISLHNINVKHTSYILLNMYCFKVIL